MNTSANLIVRVGVDLSKRLFQVHAVDRSKRIVYASLGVREVLCVVRPTACELSAGGRMLGVVPTM